MLIILIRMHKSTVHLIAPSLKLLQSTIGWPLNGALVNYHSHLFIHPSITLVQFTSWHKTGLSPFPHFKILSFDCIIHKLMMTKDTWPLAHTK